MLSMADSGACIKYDLQLRSHECYAKRWQLIRATVPITPFTERHPVYASRTKPITLRKLEVLERWLREPRCGWLAWFDADVFLADHSRALEAAWLRPSGDDAGLSMDAAEGATGLRLVMTDHHASLNNGAFLLRSGAWARTSFLPLWKELAHSKDVDWPFTDNGSMLEVILRLFAPKTYAPLTCKPKKSADGKALADGPRKFLQCMHRELDRAFGKVRETGWRGSGGLRLVAPAEGFNNHGCTAKLKGDSTPRIVVCNSSTFEQGKWGWTTADLFEPNRSFALHTKVATVLPRQLVHRATHC